MDSAKKRVVDAGYKLTKPRIAVLRVLQKAQKPYSAQEISKRVDDVDPVSVYRTLALFAKLHIVYEDSLGKEKQFCLATRPHHHVVCRTCGRVDNIPCTHDFPKKYKSYRDIEHQLSLSGICHECR
jgi:Fe2+ or Zn2+ uptake regulation protein